MQAASFLDSFHCLLCISPGEYVFPHCPQRQNPIFPVCASAYDGFQKMGPDLSDDVTCGCDAPGERGGVIRRAQFGYFHLSVFR